jgi:hypothetical protein
MVRKISAIVLVAGALTAGAVYSAQAAPRAVTAVPGVRADSLTGCLQKGSSKDTYAITDKAGNKHWVTSTSVPLSKHVGHTVTVSGASMSDSKMMSDNKMSGDSGKMSGMSDSGKMGAGKMGMSSSSMNVTSLSMVSPTCS